MHPEQETVTDDQNVSMEEEAEHHYATSKDGIISDTILASHQILDKGNKNEK